MITVTVKKGVWQYGKIKRKSLPELMRLLNVSKSQIVKTHAERLDIKYIDTPLIKVRAKDLKGLPRII